MQGPVMLVKGFTQRLHSSPEMFSVIFFFFGGHKSAQLFYPL
jgi:hypothetical protein